MSDTARLGIRDQRMAVEVAVNVLSQCLEDDANPKTIAALKAAAITLRLIEEHVHVVRAAVRLAKENPAVAQMLETFNDARIDDIREV